MGYLQSAQPFFTPSQCNHLTTPAWRIEIDQSPEDAPVSSLTDDVREHVNADCGRSGVKHAGGGYVLKTFA